MSKLFNIKPGKNIFDLDNANGKGRFIITLTNSDKDRDSIFFYDKSRNVVLKTLSENLIWYNEISDSINLTCTTTDDFSSLGLVYYSNVSKTVVLKSIKKHEETYVSLSDSLNINLKDFCETMDKKFLTNKEKIKLLVKDEMSNPVTSNINEFPLSEKTYDHNEVNAMIDVLLSDKLTMGKNVEEFEYEFASFIGSKYAIMVNSGSSANLLAMAVLSNFKCKNRFNKGDKVIVPTICWSTSVWPIIQMGLEPVFVDIDIETLNADVDAIETLLKNDSKIKGMVVVHILGNTANMDKLMKLKEEYNLIYMEDTCESLGSKYNDKYLGTFGECGTYSFYFSHHITTIEGGMVVTDDFEIYELLKCLRAHGWTRGLSKHNNTSLDNRFCFVNVGYNLRPMEIQAAMGKVQLKRLKTLNNNRIQNYERIIKLINDSDSDILTCFKKEPNSQPAWFALPFILNEKYNKEEYLNKLEGNNIATRPVVTGNFARQPVFKDLNYNIDPKIFKNAEIVHDNGFFIGLPSYYMSDDKIKYLVNILLN